METFEVESFQKLSHNEQSEYSWWFVASHCEVFTFLYMTLKIFRDIMQTGSFTWLYSNFELNQVLM